MAGLASENEAPLLQSTAMRANVVFINIDWKDARHSNLRTTKKNLRILGDTIEDVVLKMKPAMICMTEVGVFSQPLTGPHMEQVRDQVLETWRSAANGNARLRSMFKVGEPYMTVYDENQVHCSNHQVLKNIYKARGERSAQAFSCRGPGGDTIDVVSVHAPSGTEVLKNKQRQELLTNLLQSDSMARPGHSLGNGSFLIGGDMNTAPIALTALLINCRRQTVILQQTNIVTPLWAKHGDACITAGFNGTDLNVQAKNHDPQHVPYGIEWSAKHASATEQLALSSPAGSAEVADSATTQHSHAATPLVATVPQVTQSSSTRVEPPPPQVTPKPAPPLLPPGLDAQPQQPLQQAPPPQPPSQDQHDESGAGASAATEHSQEPTHNQEMIFSIVNEFLGGVTFNSTEAEDLIWNCLQEEESLPLDMQERLEEAFAPIFFDYTNGLKDRTMWTPRGPGKYIRT